MATPSNDSPMAATVRGRLRLQLWADAQDDGTDGVWWPWSRSLQVEAADLIDNFPSAAGRIQRLLFSRPDWDDATTGGRGVRMVRAARGPVKVGSFPSDDTQLMILSLASGGRVKLGVIPSATEPAEARRRLRSKATENTTVSDAWTKWDDEIPWI